MSSPGKMSRAPAHLKELHARRREPQRGGMRNIGGKSFLLIFMDNDGTGLDASATTTTTKASLIIILL